MIRIEVYKKYQGYHIIDCVHVCDVMYLIGYNRKDSKPFATYFSRNGKTYSRAKYFDSIEEAQKDIDNRIERELTVLKPFRDKNKEEFKNLFKEHSEYYGNQ